MSQQDSYNVPITFQDVAVYFSEEEWKLLQDWQRELYRDVMKEIHKALIFLGYRIVNPDVLIRLKKREETCVPDAEGRNGIHNFASTYWPSVHADILFRVQKEDSYCTDQFGLKTTEISNSFNKGISTSGASIRIKEEEHLYPIDDQNSGRVATAATILTGPVGTAVVPIQYTNQKEFEMYIKEQPVSEVRNTSLLPLQLHIPQESTNQVASVMPLVSLSAGPVVTSVFSLGQNNPEETSIKEEPETEVGITAYQCEAIDVHEKERHTCFECKKDFTRKSALERHQKIHTSEILYACSDCEKCFPRKAQLVRHVKRHKQMKPFLCTQCGKRYTQRAHLQRHQNFHTGVRHFHCTICGKSFIQKTDLQRHLCIHTGVRPFPCTECDRSFTQRSFLLQHQRIHTGLKPFPCTECEKTFTIKVSLVKHQRIHATERRGELFSMV